MNLENETLAKSNGLLDEFNQLETCTEKPTQLPGFEDITNILSSNCDKSKYVKANLKLNFITFQGLL